MRLDTIFTFADRYCVLLYPDIAYNIAAFSYRPSEKPNGIELRKEEKPFVDVAAKEIIRAQLRDASDEELAEKQRELSRLYDRFRMRYGYIDKNLKKLEPHSPVVPFLRALEVQTGKS